MKRNYGFQLRGSFQAAAIARALFCALSVSAALPTLALAYEPVYSTSLGVLKPAEFSSNRDWQANGGIRLRSTMIDEDYQKADTVGMTVYGGVTYLLMDHLTFHGEVGVNLDTGASQNTFTDEYKARQGINLWDASVTWQAPSEFTLRGGAIGQNWMASPMLLNDVAFPAVLVSWKHSFDSSFYVQLSAEEAIPTSDTTNSVPRGNDPLPTADFERITIGAGSKSGPSAQAHVGHFAFNNLPSGIALESRYRGNSVVGTGDDGSTFEYDYAGIETGARGSFPITSHISTALDLTWLTNLRTLNELSHAMRIKGEVRYEATPDITVLPSLQVFRAESDATPAYYNASSLAHDNRQGMGTGVKLQFVRSRLEFEGLYINARVIEPNPFQSDFNGVVFSLRKTYDLL